VQEPTTGTNRPVEGDHLPTVDLVAKGGATISTASLTGQPLVINTWYSTCAPCEHEMPDLAAVHRELGDTVRFVGIDAIDTEATMTRFAADHGVGYELYRDPSGSFNAAVGIATAPVTLFVTADGTIVEQSGVLDAAKLRSLIDEYLV
jgi:peroxiredoxin